MNIKRPPKQNLRELRKQEILNNLVRIKEEAPEVKLTKTKITYDKLMQLKGAHLEDSSDSTDEEDHLTD